MNDDDLTELLPPLRDDSSQPSEELVFQDGDLLEGDATAPVDSDAYFLDADFDGEGDVRFSGSFEEGYEDDYGNDYAYAGGYDERLADLSDEQQAALAAALGEAAALQGGQRKRRFRFRRWHIIVSIVLVIMIAVVTITGSFFWNRWYRFSDAQDIQGQWYVAGTEASIEITEDQLVFNEDTSYRYAMNAEDKTISFKLGNLDGLAHYCFFENRKVLIIMDGENYTRWGTAGDDFLITLDNFASLSEGFIPHYPEGEGIIVLTRSPNKYGWGNYSYKIIADENASGDKGTANTAGEAGGAGGADGAASSTAGSQQSGEQTSEGGLSTSNGSSAQSGAENGGSGQEEAVQPSASDLFASVSDIAQDVSTPAGDDAQDGASTQGFEDAQ